MEAESLKVPPDVPLDQWLTPKELAARFGLNEESVYRWRKEGRIPELCVRFRGTRNFLFHPDVIAHLNQLFAAAHLADRKLSAGTI